MPTLTDTVLVQAAVAAKATGLNKFFIYRLGTEGQIPRYKAGRAVRFSIPEILQWMKKQGEIQSRETE